jgi:hypothetical protein
MVVEIAARKVRNTVISVQRMTGHRIPITPESVAHTILTGVGSIRVSPMETRRLSAFPEFASNIPRLHLATSCPAIATVSKWNLAFFKSPLLQAVMVCKSHSQHMSTHNTVVCFSGFTPHLGTILISGTRI